MLLAYARQFSELTDLGCGKSLTGGDLLFAVTRQAPYPFTRVCLPNNPNYSNSFDFDYPLTSFTIMRSLLLALAAVGFAIQAEAVDCPGM